MKNDTGFLKILKNACCVFTILIFVVYLAITLVFGGAAFTTNLINTAALFVLSFAVAASELIYKKTKLPFAAAHIIVFIALGILYYLIVILLPGLNKDGGKVAVAAGIYVIAFLIATIVIVCKRGRKKAAVERAKVKEYKPKF